MKEKIDWSGILFFKEIGLYLSLANNSELSICSSKLRDKLYKNKFKPFQLREHLKKEDYRTFEVEIEGKRNMYENPFKPPREIIQVSVNKFEIELQTLSPTVKTLIIYDQYDYLYGYKIADRFVNITSLNLSQCTITRGMFIHLLSNLKLTELSIRSTDVLFAKNSCGEVFMPQSLKKIEIIDAKYCLVNHEIDALRFRRKNCYVGAGDSVLNEQHIENLIILYYTARYSSGLTKFIELNPQLKSLTIHQHGLLPTEISALIKNNQIKHLDSEYTIKPISESGPHIFKSLKSLVTMVGSDINYFIDIAKSCPNLTRLTTYINSIQCINNSISYAGQLENLNYFSLKSYATKYSKLLLIFQL